MRWSKYGVRWVSRRGETEGNAMLKMLKIALAAGSLLVAVPTMSYALGHARGGFHGHGFRGHGFIGHRHYGYGYGRRLYRGYGYAAYRPRYYGLYRGYGYASYRPRYYSYGYSGGYGYGGRGCW